MYFLRTTERAFELRALKELGTNILSLQLSVLYGEYTQNMLIHRLSWVCFVQARSAYPFSLATAMRLGTNSVSCGMLQAVVLMFYGDGR